MPTQHAVQNLALRRLVTASASVSLCIAARNEEATIGTLVRDINRTLVRRKVVMEVVVIDDRSEDLTSLAAQSAGARVVSSDDLLQGFGPSQGRGDAMWRSLAASTGQIVVWCDADLSSFDTSRLEALVEPLREDRRIRMSKGYFRRVGPSGDAALGGRVTELVARPLLGLLFPQVNVCEPLSGMVAMRREAAEQLAFETDEGVDVGLLIDTVTRWGADAVIDVDLGEMAYRNQPVEALNRQAEAVQRSILARSTQLSAMGTRPRTVAPSNPQRPPLASVTNVGRADGLPARQSLRDRHAEAFGPAAG